MAKICIKSEKFTPFGGFFVCRNTFADLIFFKRKCPNKYRQQITTLFFAICNKPNLHIIVSLIMSQLILSEMEDRYPKGTLVTIEEEPRILQRIQIANDMRLPCWRIALGTHDSDLLPLASHIHRNLTHGHMPYMKFLSVRSDVCRRLLSDFTSR